MSKTIESKIEDFFISQPRLEVEAMMARITLIYRIRTAVSVAEIPAGVVPVRGRPKGSRNKPRNLSLQPLSVDSEGAL